MLSLSASYTHERRLLRGTEKLTVNPNSFRIDYLVYYKLGCYICCLIACYMQSTFVKDKNKF